MRFIAIWNGCTRRFSGIGIRACSESNRRRVQIREPRCIPGFRSLWRGHWPELYQPRPRLIRGPCLPSRHHVETDRRSLLAHPDAPRDRAGFLIGNWTARHLEGQLDLAMMVALVPKHVLQQEDRVIVV